MKSKRKEGNSCHNFRYKTFNNDPLKVYQIPTAT